MATRIRVFDWSTTPLGSIADWPQSLKTVVDLMLASPSMMSLAWGAEAIHLYNDSFTELLQEHHTHALGRSAFVTFARSRDIFAADVAAGMAGRSKRLLAQCYPVLRNGQLSDAWFDAEYAPVRDEAGSVRGVLWTLKEVTAQVVAERALRESEVRSKLLIGTWAQATWETDQEGIVVADSPSWRAYTGQTLEEWLGHGWLGTIHPDDRAHAEQQWREAMSAGSLVDAEFRLRAPDGGWRWTNVRAAPVLHPDRSIAKWIGMNIDIHARKRAEDALRAREADLMRVQRIGRVGGLDIDVSGGLISERSPEFLRLHGLSPESLHETHADWRARVHPHDVDEAERRLFAALRGTGSSYDSEYRIVRRSDGEVRWIHARVDIERDTEGRATRMVGAHLDITDQKRMQEGLRESEERQAFLLRLSDALRPLTDSDALEQTATRLLGEHLGADRVFYATIDGDGETWRIRHDYTANLPSQAGSYPLSDFQRRRLLDWEAGRLSSVDDSENGTLSEADRAAYAAVGARAAIGIPLVKGSRFAALLAVNQTNPRAWTAAEIELTRDAAERTWAEIERARIQEELRGSEKRLQKLVEASSDAVFTADADWQHMRLLNDAGGSGEARTAVDWLATFLPASEHERVRSAIREAKAEKRGFELEHRVQLPDGSPGWAQTRAVPLLDNAGVVREWFGTAIDVTVRREAAGRLRTLVAGIPQLVWRAVEDGQWTWSSPQWTAYTGLSVEESRGEGWLRAVHEDDRARAHAFWRESKNSGRFELDARLRHRDGGFHWFQNRATPVHDDHGGIIEWLGTSTDVNDLHELQQRQVLLVAELQHRVRNVLGVVRSVFARTVEAGGPIEEVADHFKGRLDALARTQVIVTQSAHGTVNLENLIRDELLSVGVHADGAKVVIDGPDVTLPGKTAESIGMAVHELTTNAVKYGAIVHPTANLRVTWNVNLGGFDSPRLELYWVEQGVPTVELSPRRYGFGRELIEEALPYRLRAETRLEFRGGGVRCFISMPLPKAGAAADQALEQS